MHRRLPGIPATPTIKQIIARGMRTPYTSIKRGRRPRKTRFRLLDELERLAQKEEMEDAEE